MAGTLGVIGGTLAGGGGSATTTDPTSVAWSMSNYVTATASATAHTKGTWMEAVASTDDDCTIVIVDVANVYVNGTDTAILLDIATGASGSESIVIGDIGVGGAVGSGTYPYQVRVPLAIPSGTRIAVRIQAITGSDTARVRLFGLLGGGFSSPSSVTTIGSSTTTSSGTELGTSWTEIVASTAETYRYLVIIPSLSTSDAVASSSSIIVGTGASGSEAEVGSVPTSTNSLEMIHSRPYPEPGWLESCILVGCAAGTRIVAKRDQPCDITILGIP